MSQDQLPDMPLTPTVVVYQGIIVPTAPTLRKYGLDRWDWMKIIDRDGAHCGACGKIPKTLRLVIDHEHVRGWKALAPADRKQYVRGLLCWTCNGFRLARGATVENLRGAALYLECYLKRKAS